MKRTSDKTANCVQVSKRRKPVKCQVNECTATARFMFKTTYAAARKSVEPTVPTHCKTHKVDGMCDLWSNLCICGARASMGFANDDKPTCCARCREPTMVNIRTQKCRCGKAQPMFGYEGDARICCAQCKDPGMVN